jgi:hypothetical protein
VFMVICYISSSGLLLFIVHRNCVTWNVSMSIRTWK